MSAFLLHLLRHGAPETPGLLLGRTDAAPTQGGIEACLRQASGIAFDTVLSSDLLRTHRAAQAIAARHAVPLITDPRWRELDFGDWDGQRPSAIAKPDLDRFWDDPDVNPPPGGERWSDLTTRVGGAIETLECRSTLVVTHGGAMRAALARLCGFALPQLWAFDLDYAALLSLKVWPGPGPSAQIVGLHP